MEKAVSADAIYNHLYIEGVMRLNGARTTNFKYSDWNDEIFPAIVKSCKFIGVAEGVAQSLSPCLLNGFLEGGLVKPFDPDVFEIKKTRVAFLSEFYFG